MLRAVIFDMDGLLIDSEPLWHEAEIEVFGAVGLKLTADDCRQTAGLRIDEVVALRHRQRPFQGATPQQVTARIVDRVVQLVRARGEAKPGVHHALAFVAARPVRVALASSSPTVLIEATLERLGLRGAFSAIHSAEGEPRGKPHPAVYLTLCARLGLEPTACLAVEDSLNGVLAAKAGRLVCLAVPDGPADPRLVIADRLLPSLADLDEAVWAALGGPA